jgi:hypothetical protein
MKIFDNEFIIICDRDGVEIFTIDLLRNALKAIIVRESLKQEYKVYFAYRDKLNLVKRPLSKSEIRSEIRYKIIEQGARISPAVRELTYKMAGVKMPPMLTESKICRTVKSYKKKTGKKVNSYARKR